MHACKRSCEGTDGTAAGGYEQQHGKAGWRDSWQVPPREVDLDTHDDPSQIACTICTQTVPTACHADSGIPAQSIQDSLRGEASGLDQGWCHWSCKSAVSTTTQEQPSTSLMPTAN